MLASTTVRARKIGVLLVGRTPQLFSFIQPTLDRVGCRCYFAQSQQEISKLLRRATLDIVLSLNAHLSLSRMIALLAGRRVSVFHTVAVERGCWWLPVFRNGENCLGAAAFRPNEFAQFLGEIVMDLGAKARSELLPATQALCVP